MLLVIKKHLDQRIDINRYTYNFTIVIFLKEFFFITKLKQILTLSIIRNYESKNLSSRKVLLKTVARSLETNPHTPTSSAFQYSKVFLGDLQTHTMLKSMAVPAFRQPSCDNHAISSNGVIIIFCLSHRRWSHSYMQ